MWFSPDVLPVRALAGDVTLWSMYLPAAITMTADTPDVGSKQMASNCACPTSILVYPLDNTSCKQFDELTSSN